MLMVLITGIILAIYAVLLAIAKAAGMADKRLEEINMLEQIRNQSRIMEGDNEQKQMCEAGC